MQGHPVVSERLIGTLMILAHAAGRSEPKTFSFLRRHDEYGVTP